MVYNMLVKFIDEETIEVFKDYYIDGETVYTNAEAEKFAIEEGYKELIIEDKPSYNGQEEFLTEYFEETTENVIKKWKVKKMSENQEG